MSGDELARLQDWYLAQCDDEWEHQNGITIESLDNPGWQMRIDVAGTALEDAAFADVRDALDDPALWLRCWREGRVFHGACGPLRLADMLRVFLDWAAQPGNGHG